MDVAQFLPAAILVTGKVHENNERVTRRSMSALISLTLSVFLSVCLSG